MSGRVVLGRLMPPTRTAAEHRSSTAAPSGARTLGWVGEWAAGEAADFGSAVCDIQCGGQTKRSCYRRIRPAGAARRGSRRPCRPATEPAAPSSRPAGTRSGRQSQRHWQIMPAPHCETKQQLSDAMDLRAPTRSRGSRPGAAVLISAIRLYQMPRVHLRLVSSDST
jgi:hypothetical protein